MKLKEIYMENKARRYSSIQKVMKENIVLEMDPIKKMKENWIVLLAIFVIVVGCLLIDYNPKYFYTCLGIILVFIALFIFGNKAYLKCDKNSLYIKQGFQKLNIPYDHLKSVYIGRVRGFSYNIIIRFQDNFSFLRELEFSLLCSKPEDVNEFISNFIIEKQVQTQYVTYEKRKFFRRSLSTVFTILLFIIILIYYVKHGGINIF